MRRWLRLENNKQFWTVVLATSLIMAFQLVTGYFVIQQSTLGSFTSQLSDLTLRVQKDLVFKNGKWDLERYLSDPQTPHPNGSSGFSNSLYILTTDGFVIERNLPISGFHDVSNFKEFLTFSSPKTIISPTNEEWRVLASPIVNDGETLGVIVVSNYNPLPSDDDSIDTELQNAIKTISSKLSFNNKNINSSKIEISSIPYNISFEIVNKYNKVLLNNGRTPSLIDPSYVFDEMKKPSLRQITSNATGEEFLVKTQIVNDGSSPKGLVIVGKSLVDLNLLLRNYIVLSLLFDGLILIPLSFFLNLSLIHLQTMLNKKTARNIHSIRFDKAKSLLQINESEIQIPYASNQYYLLKTLFRVPKKRWEHDELLEAIGEEPKRENQRKIYDAILAINKRAELKLIVYEDRTYFLNPLFSKFLP